MKWKRLDKGQPGKGEIIFVLRYTKYRFVGGVFFGSVMSAYSDMLLLEPVPGQDGKIMRMDESESLFWISANKGHFDYPKPEKGKE